MWAALRRMRHDSPHVIVPTLCVNIDAERQPLSYHAERGNDHRLAREA